MIKKATTAKSSLEQNDSNPTAPYLDVSKKLTITAWTSKF